MHIHQDQLVTFPKRHTFTHTHAQHVCMYITRTLTSTSDSLVYNKMIVRMATARRRTTTARTALTATTAGIWSVLPGQEPVVWGSM